MKTPARGKLGSGKTLMRGCDAWLRKEERRGEAVAAAVAALDFPPPTVDVFAQMHGEGVTVGVARRLAARAHALINTNPKKSATLALLAGRVADAAPCPAKFVAGLDTTRGEAWMRYAAALFELGNFPRAWEAAERADTYFQLAAPFPSAFRSEATLGLIQGKILHFLGQTDRGLLRIEQSANLILRAFKEPDKYVEAMTIYNAILMHADRFEQAARGWQEIAGLARDKGDRTTLAHIVNNVGRCYLQLGETQEAERCFATALELFHEVNLKTMMPDIRLNLAYALRQAGRFGEAILQMYECRSEFAKFGMMFNAAEVCIRIVETRVLSKQNDDVLHLCEEAVAFFRAAGLPEQAQRTADNLLNAAQTNTVGPEAVREVCASLGRLRDLPYVRRV